MRGLVLSALLLCGLSGSAFAQQLPTATARLIDTRGRDVGLVRLTETPIKGVLLSIRVSGLTPGTHAVHIHETGSCEPPAFESAGEHFNPWAHAHGARSPNGMHAGDLLNLQVPGEGTIEVERLARDVTLGEGFVHSLFDEDGSSIVVHARADDNVSQPSGNSGDPVACGVIVR